MSSVSTVEDKIHPLAKIIKQDLLDNPKFTFNHISMLDHYWVRDSNGSFPVKRTCSLKSYFLWRYYGEWSCYDDHKDNPDYLYSSYENYIFDGTSIYWDNSIQKYKNGIPNSWEAPDNETSTDISRRELYYIKEQCEWALLDCSCSWGGPCLQVLNDYDYKSKIQVSLGTVNTLEERINLINLININE
jgi:hypothetical protein